MVVIHRRIAFDQLTEAIEQVLQTKHRPDALVQRVLVDDQGKGESKGVDEIAVRPGIARIVS